MIIEDVIIIAGLGAVGALWIFSLAGMLHVAWETTLKPIADCIKKRR